MVALPRYAPGTHKPLAINRLHATSAASNIPTSRMRVLILGGTQFIGRHIVESLLATGHIVTTLTRGKSLDQLPSEVERLRGDRDEGLSGLEALRSRSWDLCVDVSGYTPRQVRPSAEMLRASVGRYVFVSAVSVYGDPQDRPVRETHPRLPVGCCRDHQGRWRD